MLSEVFLTSVSGPPIAANTAVSKDVGIYTHTLSPSVAVKSTFKKSSCPRHGLAASATHIFAAQDQKAHVHVYSRARGNQEALVPFAERIRSLTLVGNILIVGTIEGRLILWDTCTGRQVTTPPCHVQAVCCIAANQHYVLSGSDDANINVWSLAHLLEADVQSEPEPEIVLSNHRGAITDLVVGPSNGRETALCVSTSRDKTCILWNYRTGQALRTLLYPEVPICARLDPSARALFVMSEGRALFLTELFGEKPLLGSQASEPASIVIQIKHPIGVADEDAGVPSCLAVSYDGTSILTGHTRGRLLQWSLTDDSHPVELANLNASVTNILFTPLISHESKVEPVTITKPNQSLRQITFNAKLNGNGTTRTRFHQMVNSKGFSSETIEEAMLSFADPVALTRNHWN